MPQTETKNQCKAPKLNLQRVPRGHHPQPCAGDDSPPFVRPHIPKSGHAAQEAPRLRSIIRHQACQEPGLQLVQCIFRLELVRGPFPTQAPLPEYQAKTIHPLDTAVASLHQYYQLTIMPAGYCSNHCLLILFLLLLLLLLALCHLTTLAPMTSNKQNDNSNKMKAAGTKRHIH